MPKPRQFSRSLTAPVVVAKTLLSGRQRGFTLIELIMVIVLLGILSFGTTQFIVNSSQSYVDTARWQQQGSSVRAAVEKISRELRNALPNSVRVVDRDGFLSADKQGDCIEFVPVLADSIYTSLPLAAPATLFNAVPFVSSTGPSINPQSSRVSVYPINANDIYLLSATSTVSSLLDASSMLEGTAEVAVLMQQPHRFPRGSPGQRWFMVSDPISFCIDSGGRLFRYSRYGFQPAQPTPGLLGHEAVPERSLLAVGVRGRFGVTPALVQLTLAIRERGEGFSISHEVALRHVP